MKYATLSKVFKLSALAASLALALAAAPAQAFVEPPQTDAGPTFSTSTACVLNRLGAGDCIISGTVGSSELSATPAGAEDSSFEDFESIVSGIFPTFADAPTSLRPVASFDDFPSIVSGTYPTLAGAPTSFVSDATLTAASISGSPDVSVIGFGCNNTAAVLGATNPCFINVAVRAGGVVGGVVQGELSYTYNALSGVAEAGDTFVQTGVIHPAVHVVFEEDGVTPQQPPPGFFLVDNGLVDPITTEWDYYSDTTIAVGYTEETAAGFSSVSVTVDPPVSSYLNVDVGGTFDSPLVVLGEDGQRIGDASVLGSNTPESFGLSSPGSGVPEPTTLGLLGLGVLAAAFGRKRRGIVGV
jgi:hypothetical protein